MRPDACNQSGLREEQQSQKLRKRLARSQESDKKPAVGRAFILLSHERSGSHFVGEFLGSLSNFRMFDEVCNPDAVKPAKHRESFHRFKHDKICADPSFLLEPTREKHVAFVGEYLESLRQIAAPRSMVVDIKYGHVQNFEAWWWPILERPTLMQVCEAKGIGIIHLFRENVIEATVSSMVADRRKIWHSWQSRGEAKDESFDLPVPEIIRRAKLLDRQKYWFREWIKRNSKFEMSYERVSSELGSGGELDASLTTFLGSSLKAEFAPRHQKLTRPLREVMQNFAELKSACESVGMGQYLG
jgi:hypothetical protein